MNAKQLGILNALVTYAAENVPGGLSEDEQEVARIVGIATLYGEDVKLSARRYEYKTINTSHFGEAGAVEKAANAYAEEGWRAVAAIGARGPGYADALIIERPIQDPILGYQIADDFYSPEDVTIVRGT